MARNYEGPEVTVQNARLEVLKQIIHAARMEYAAADVRNLAGAYEILRNYKDPA